MPISGAASFLPTTSQFLDHWQDVDTALGVGSPLILRKETLNSSANVARADLETLYDTLVAQHMTVQASVVEVDLARGELFDAKTRLAVLLAKFNDKVRALLANTKWERALPDLPQVDAGRGIFSDAISGALALWLKINSTGAAGGSLNLRDGESSDDLSDELNNLDVLYRALSRMERTLKLEREERNDLQDRIYPILRQYRVAVPGFFSRESAIMAALPRLTPELGHTPEPVNASGVWVAAQTQARLEWTASADPDLAEYEIRYSPGTEYHNDVEDVIASIPAGDPLVFLTDHALTQPGATALFKVYVILNTGNESGSNAVAVTRT